MNSYDFTEGQHSPPEQWTRPGKSEWPDLITIRLKQSRALEIIAQLARQIQRGDDIELVLFGELTPARS